MDEQRDRMRLALKKLAFAKSGDVARGGLLRDISSGGAGLQFVNPMGAVEHPFTKDDTVEIIIDGFQSLNAKVVRTEQESIFVAFEINNDQEEMLIAEIMAAANDIVLEERA